MARELISSDGTFYYKFGLPLFWTLLGGFGFFEAFADPNPSSPGGVVLFYTAWLGGSILLWASGARLRTVWIEGQNFIVSRFRREDIVPFTAVREVSSNRFSNPATIKLVLDEGLGFGGSIRFMPPIKLFSFPGREHPMAARLRQIIAERP